MQRFYKIVEQWLRKSGWGRATADWLVEHKKVAELFDAIFVAVMLYLIISTCVIQAFKIPSKSMVPTLGVGDRLFVNKFIYWFTDPKAGDIIVFEVPETIPNYDPSKPIYIKRIVGTPGDLVEIAPDDNSLLINGEKLKMQVYVHNLSNYNLFAKQFFNLTKDLFKRKYLSHDPSSSEFRSAKIDFAGNQFYHDGESLTLNGEAVTQSMVVINNKYYQSSNHKYLGTEVPEDSYYVFGDNSQSSYDSRYWGAVPRKNIKGKAFFRYWPLERIGPLR